MRDWLLVRTKPEAEFGRVLLRTPHEIGVIVAHRSINYGAIIEHDDHLLRMLKQTVFRAVRDAITDSTA